MLIKHSVCYRVAVVMMLGVLACHSNRRPPESGWPAHFGFGKTATRRQIDSLNISIAPDGKGLPSGNGNATTVFDYIRRAMPFNAPGSLTDEEVYSVTAFLLYRNKVIDSTLLLNAVNLPQVVMPAKKYYVDDNRRGGNEVR